MGTGYFGATGAGADGAAGEAAATGPAGAAGVATNGPGSAQAGVGAGALASLPPCFRLVWYTPATRSIEWQSL